MTNGEKIKASRKKHRRCHKPTLCWDCQRAAGKWMCAWAALGKPVSGWTAEKSIISQGGDNPDSHSYRVIGCPLYIPDRKMG